MRGEITQLHMDGRPYTWWTEIRYVSGRREVRVRAWGAGKNSQALQVDLHAANQDHWLVDNCYPTSADIHHLIIEGLAAGRQPDARTSTFTLPRHHTAAA